MQSKVSQTLIPPWAKILSSSTLVITCAEIKACVRYFLSIFYFSPNDSPSKTMKNVSISSKKLFSFAYLFKFLYTGLSLFFSLSAMFLALKDPFIAESCIEIKIELTFYFHTSLWCHKRFYEGL